MTSSDINAWLTPVSEPLPCGPDLSYASEFLALQREIAGAPESQFSEARPPNWSEVRDQATRLMAQTRDLRVALAWGRASIRLQGLPALPILLGLLADWVLSWWPQVHPTMELGEHGEPDALPRLIWLMQIDAVDGVLGDLWQARAAELRAFALLNLKALAEPSAAVPSEASPPSELTALLQQHPGVTTSLRQAADAALQQLNRLQHALTELPEVQALRDVQTVDSALQSPRLRQFLTALQGRLRDNATEIHDPLQADPRNAAPMASAAGPEAPSPTHPPASGDGWARAPIRSRLEALRCLTEVRTFLQQSEPSHPAPWLLLRAERLMNHNFLQLVQAFAPEATDSVARTLGVNPDDWQALASATES